MKILIMVQSWDHPPYDTFMKAQRETWDSVETPGVETLFYHGDNTGLSADRKVFGGGCGNDYEMMHWMFKLALDQVMSWEWDYIFRTNSSAYIHKGLLQKRAEDLPRIGCYAGWNNGTYISGAGCFMSRDVVELLLQNYTPAPHGAEDVLMGEILGPLGIRNYSMNDERFDMINNGAPIPVRYHYRFKTSNRHTLADRQADIDNIYKVHERLRRVK